MKNTEQKYAKTGPASQMLGVSRRWLSELADQGRIPYAQVSSRTRLFKIADLEAWIEQHTIRGAA